MKRIHWFFLSILFLLSASCMQENATKKDWKKANTSQKKDHYIVTSLGDSIPSGVPLPIRGKEIDSDSVAKPKTVTMSRQARVVTLQSNVYPAGQPKQIVIPKKPRATTIGKDGVPFPETVPALGESVPAIQTRPIKSGAPQMKAESISNLQFWTIDQGLNASHIVDLLEDRRGHIWIITSGGGVSRFDGNHFIHYTINEGLPFNDPLTLMEDSQGNLWIGGFQGLVRYDGHRFTHFTQKNGLVDVVIYSMYEDSKGELWFGGHGHLTRYDPDKLSFTHYNNEHGLVKNLPIRAIEEDRFGNLWLGTVWAGLFRFELPTEGMGGRFTHFGTEQGFGNMFISSILEDRRGHLWLGTSKGAYQLDITNNDLSNTILQYTSEEGLSGNGIGSIVEDSQGNMWFGTNNGVDLFDLSSRKTAGETGGTFTHFTKQQGLSGNRVQCILEDSQGNMWFGTQEGLNRYCPGRFNYISHEELKNYPIPTIFKDRGGQLWFGASGGPVGLSKLAGEMTSGQSQQSLSLFTNEEGLRNHHIRSLTEDNQGRLWIGFYNEGGLAQFNPPNGEADGTFTYYHFAEGLLGPYVHAVCADRQGNIWVGSVGGLSCYTSRGEEETGRRFIHFTREEGFPSFVVLSILEDSKGNLWFGTQRGVSRLKPGKNVEEGRFTHFTSNEGLSNGWVSSIMEDVQGNIWFGTSSGGVSRYDPTTESGHSFIRFTTDDGLSHNIVQSILEDDEHNIWIGTQKGLSLLKPKLNIKNRTRSLEKDAYQIFTFKNEDGLKNINFSQGVGIDRRRWIWWGLDQGVTMLDLNQFKFSADPPDIKLSTIEVEQAYLDYRRLADPDYYAQFSFGASLSQSFDSVAAYFNYPLGLVLPYNLNHLTFEFCTTDWSAPHKIQYSYWMKGVDKDWSKSVAEPKVEYRSLPYGRHVLSVRAMGEAQIWSEPYEYRFSILPPWWLSTWAYVIYALLAVASIWGILQWRTSTLRKRQKVLEQTVKDRTAEVVAQKDELAIKNEIITKEKERSDELLLNILPEETAKELKQYGAAKAKNYDMVTVLFTDFVEFTQHSERLTPEELVAEIDHCFKAFDQIMDQYNVEKIKTVGDAYMAAAGLPTPNTSNPEDAINAALAIRDFMLQYKSERAAKGREVFEIRIGVHTGPVVAGIVGMKKFAYDIWGDTVNLAARMESSGEKGRVNISRGTYHLVKDHPAFRFEARGKVSAKNKGEIEMYFAESADT